MERQPEALLAEIVARPEDDELRRLYAASIAPEHSTYADYICRSLDLSRRDYPYNDPPESLARELEAPFKERGARRCDFYRGFVETLWVEPAVFMEQGDTLLDLAPILKVVFVTRDKPDRWTYWRDYLPELVQCPALGRVRELGFCGKPAFDFAAMRLLFQSPHLDSLLTLSSYDMNWQFWMRDSEADEAAMWDVALESPVFRRLLDWTLRTEEEPPYSGPAKSRLMTRRQLGDRRVKERYGTSGLLTTYEPMSAESRALEETYGYIPCLHAGNWGATVLDVLRGKKPDFPAGARPTEAMYAVPPPDDHRDTGW